VTANGTLTSAYYIGGEYYTLSNRTFTELTSVAAGSKTVYYSNNAYYTNNNGSLLGLTEDAELTSAYKIGETWYTVDTSSGTPIFTTLDTTTAGATTVYYTGSSGSYKFYTESNGCLSGVTITNGTCEISGKTYKVNGTTFDEVVS